jgi:glutamate-ammonia-ligase adenylyltransferase
MINDHTPPLDTLPETLQSGVAAALEQIERLPEQPQIAASLPQVWACSEFVARTCGRSPALLADLTDSGDLERAYRNGELTDRLGRQLAAITDEADLHRVLRRFREREQVRIAWRDIAGWAELQETLRELSALADACIDGALQWLYERLTGQWGVPRDADGAQQRLVVLGMGKLGGEELNFSSDIDLIFAYPEAGETDAARPRSNEEFFIRLGQQLIAALDRQTPDGQVFRVDMRLRPYGGAGPLAMSFNGMELYYQAQGREWERYALIKARVVGGDREAGDELLRMLRPFVYRRYLDYGALEALREMKSLVAREVRRKGLEDNVKLGRGGIREVEFIAQAFQLIRGGQDRALQCRQLLPVLDYLTEHGLLPEHAGRELVEGYRFLRRTENRLQAMHDRQTHDLPADAIDRARLALAMGFDHWDGFCAALADRRRRIQGHFDQVFVAPQREGDASDEIGLDDVWQGTLDIEQADALLADCGFGAPARTRERLEALRDSRSTRALSASGRARLDRLMPLMVQAVAAQDQPDETLDRLLTLLEGIVRRTAYLALLVEHPMALSQLVQLAAGSPWVTRLLAKHPLLLDELLDPRTLYAPLRREGLAAELNQRLNSFDADDLDAQMEELRRFQQANTLRVAAADISGALPIMVVSDYLSDIAEVVLDAVLRLAWHHVTQRYGRPMGEMDGAASEQGFVILAYGKLGSLELGYGSDLDLVFVHEQTGGTLHTDGERSVDNAVFFARLAQRIIHILSTPTPGGILYDVDTRLRPSGKSGLLTASLDAFADYQRRTAWTWEHQALVRARVVAGSSRLADAVRAVRDEIIARERDPGALRREVVGMRRRMVSEKASRKPGVFALKQDSGGIADIEFMVQYGVLAGAHAHPGLRRYTDNIRLLDELSRSGMLSADQARMLADAYRAYRARIHRLTLQEQPPEVPAERFATERHAVQAIWREVMSPDETKSED